MSSNGIESFKEIGFKKIGEFKKSKIKDKITIEIKYEDEYYKNNSEKYEFSYVFTEFDGNKEKIFYVGQSTQGCHKRFRGYVNVKKKNIQQSTNLKIKEAICKILEDKNNKVNIYILRLTGKEKELEEKELELYKKMKSKGININIHLGLEPGLIKIAKEDNTNCLNGKRYPKELPQIEQKNKDIK